MDDFGFLTLNCITFHWLEVMDFSVFLSDFVAMVSIASCELIGVLC